MILGTYHAHTEFCDGSSTAEEMILAAIEGGAREIGLTPHSPVSGESWCMRNEEINMYKGIVASLKQKYKNSIRVFAGIEEEFVSSTDTKDFDFVIGSVHSVTVKGENLWVDLSAVKVRENVNKYFNSDAYKYTEAYYERVSKVYEKTHCDIIGHFDLVTKFLDVDPLFSVTDERYIKQRNEALEALLKTPAVFEINTGAISRGYRTTPYPDDYCLNRIAECGKPFVINSDSHKKNTVLFGIEEQRRRLKTLGIPYVSSLSEVLSLTRGTRS